MRKRSLWVVAIVGAVALALGGCSLLFPGAEFAGKFLKVDSAGHFEEEVVYREGNLTMRLGTDGSFEIYSESYEAAGQDSDGDGVSGEGWVKTDGIKGTYTWDPETFGCTRVQVQEIVDGAWTNVADQTTETCSMYYGEHQWGYVLLAGAAEGQWTATTTIEIQNQGTITYEETATFDGVSYSYMLEEMDEDTGGNVVYGYAQEESGTVVMLPEGTEWKKDTACTMLITVTLSRYRDYNTASGGWDPWVEDNDQYRMSADVYNGRDYLIDYAALTAMRRLRP